MASGDQTKCLSTPQLQEIVARASTLDERCATELTGTATDTKGIAAWCASAADGDFPAFQLWLAARGLQPDSALSLLSSVAFSSGNDDLPAWAVALEWSATAMASSPPPTLPFLNSQWPVPFEQLLSAVIHEAQRRCDLLLGAAAGTLSQTASAALARQLLVRLSELLSPVLYHDFCLFRMTNAPFGMCLATPDASSQSSELYAAFVAQLRAGGLTHLFLERPVLARLLGTAVYQWIEATSEAIVRLSRDLDEIRRRFSACPVSPEDGRCVNVSYGCSDLHSGGRGVLFFEFADGFKVVYKPRDLSIDDAWAGLLRWLAAAGAPSSAVAPAVLPRAGYGWCEWIEPVPCRDTTAAAEYFQRSGATLCLLYVLQATDIHFENVIARGEQPVVVDLETLMHPWLADRLSSYRAGEAFAAASASLSESVVATLFLPKWELAARGRIAGLGALNLPDANQVLRWRYSKVNTDSMSLLRQAEDSVTSTHLPRLDGKFLPSSAYIAEVCFGFEHMYRFLLQNHSKVAAPDGPLAAFRGHSVRTLLRPTQLYFLLMKRSLEQQNLVDGSLWSCHFDFLARAHDWEDKDSEWIPVLASERAAMAQSDIPLFWTTTDSRDLHVGPTVVASGFFDRASFDQVLERLTQLSESELARQLKYITQSLESQNRWLQEPDLDATEHQFDNSGRNFSVRHGEQCALKVAQTLLEQAVTRGGDAAWIGAVPIGGDERTQLEVTGYDLYSGIVGIALFFAALWRVTGEASSRDIAMTALRGVRECLSNPGQAKRLARTIGIGGGTGIGSVVYALTRASGLLDDSSLLQDATMAAELITEGRILADRNFDVMSGTAGALLGLLSLHRATGDSRILVRATTCGQHLLDGRTEFGSGEKLWLTLGEKPLAGMSHGVSGIAYALAGLYGATGNSALLDAIHSALAYERSIFSEGAGNWPDLREHSAGADQAPFLCRWCHGAPGIALTRLALSQVIPDGYIGQELDIALEATMREPLRQVDNVCCGNFGRIEVLLTAGMHERLPELVAAARSRAAFLAERAATRRRWGWQSGSDDLNPGFFTGLAGIGYTMLRLSHPGELPCVIAWE